MGQDVRSPRGPRCIALVGPFQSGKTTLLEAILARTGAIKNAGSVDAGTSVGDASPEARRHKMGVGLSAATTTFMGDSYTFIDCPGSIEFAHDMRAALPAVDAAVVVCEADEKKLPQLQIILRELEDLGIPRFLFLNKIDRANKRIRETLATLQPASRVPLVLRQIPIWNGELIEGFVDLALERAFVYREHKPSEVVALEGGNLDREKEARFSMLEKLADHDDALMEQLLEDIQPPRDAVFDDLARELREGLRPGAARRSDREHGVLRLMKALRHEAPGVAETAKRLGAMPRISAARANEQRGRILDAALTCFAREGFHAATVQDIVEESGLSPGAIYGYFKGKTEIAMAIASERHAMERRRMEFALAAPDIDTGLRRLVEGFVLELRNPKERRWRHLAVQLWAESLSNPRLKREALAGVSQAVDVLAPMIAQAQRQGRWPRHLDPPSAARVMVAVLQGISLQLAWDERVDIERFAVALRIMLDPRSDGSGATGWGGINFRVPDQGDDERGAKSRCARGPTSRNQLDALQRIFPACQNLGTGGASEVAEPNHGPSSRQGGGNGTRRQKSPRSTVHCAGGPFPER